jgi:hypothetical protein
MTRVYHCLDWLLKQSPYAPNAREVANVGQFRRFRKSSSSSIHHFQDQHRFEHWYVDNQMYFITARCRDKYAAFESEQAKAVFWDRFDCYTAKYDFTPCATALLNNHYHALGFL